MRFVIGTGRGRRQDRVVARPRALYAAIVASVAVVALSACGGSETKPSASPQVPAESTTAATPPATARVRVLIVGTSLTAGLGLSPDDAYPAVLQRLADSASLNVHIVAAGLSGETTAGARDRIDWLLRQRADVVVIESGANDGLRGVDPAATRANLVAIIERVRAHNPDVRILLTQMEAPPNFGPTYTRAFHDTFMQVAGDEGVTLIPFFLDGVAAVPRLNQPDGIHPNEEGARRAARNMWRTLMPLLRTVPGAVTR
jgi:acyl-CoA thioesterase-1